MTRHNGRSMAKEVFRNPPPPPRGTNPKADDGKAQVQRNRLMMAMVEDLSGNTWGEITISSLVSRAGVSRTAFYENFDDKLDCLLSAYDIFASETVNAAVETVDSSADFETAARQAVHAYLSTIRKYPISARAFFVEMDAAGPRARERRRGAVHNLASVFAERHRTLQAGEPDFEPLPFRIYLGFALGLRELIRDELEGNRDAVLTDMADDLYLWIMTIFRGTPS